MAQYDVPEERKKASPFKWPEGKRVAVSLTFDDARFSQIKKGIPLLDEYGVKATFYISPKRAVQMLEQWRAAAAKGHEIGNHTVSHPCTGNYGFSRDNALEDYTLEHMAQELDSANVFILENIGIQAVSFAYPCGQKYVGRGQDVQSYVPLVAEKFLTGRGWLGEHSNDPRYCDFAQLLGMESDGKSFRQLKALVDKTAEEGGWLILAGHEMDKKGAQTTQLKPLEKLLRYAQDPANGIWMDTVENVARYIASVRGERCK